MEILPDHVHLFVKCQPVASPHYIVQQFKGYSGAMATTSAMNINVTGRISGSDIVLSYDKTKDNKSR